MELGRIEKVIFYSVSGAIYLHIFKSGNGLQSTYLYVHRERRGETVQVVFIARFRLRLYEKLMLLLVGEGHNLRLDARTIPWPDALDLPVEKRRIRQALTQNIVGRLVGIEEVPGVSPADSPSVDTYGCAGFHPVCPDSCISQLLGQPG